jgi:hypothetical protein
VLEEERQMLETKWQQFKDHVYRNRQAYISGTVCTIITAGITCLVMRSNSKQYISRDTIVTAGRDTIVAGKNVVMENVSFISSDRQGAPSWVVRCKETGEIFSSQSSAALKLGLSPSRLSQHLTGVTDHVNGLHFERICLAG